MQTIREQLDMRRLRGVLPRHDGSNAAKLQAVGFVVQEGKGLLCASARACNTFCAPAVCPVTFRSVLDGEGRVLQRAWQPITAKEFEALKTLRDNLTGRCHLVFAWMPLPVQQKQPVQMGDEKKPTEQGAFVPSAPKQEDANEQASIVPQQEEAALKAKQDQDMVSTTDPKPVKSATNAAAKSVKAKSKLATPKKKVETAKPIVMKEKTKGA